MIQLKPTVVIYLVFVHNFTGVKGKNVQMQKFVDINLIMVHLYK